MTNCEWLLKENKLEKFMRDYTSLVIYLSTRDRAKDSKGFEEIDKFRDELSQWLLSEKADCL